MRQETQGAVKGNQPAHVEEGRETEPFPDDTDPREVQDSLNPNPGTDTPVDGGTSDD